jgi:hypothetical protein
MRTTTGVAVALPNREGTDRPIEMHSIGASSSQPVTASALATAMTLAAEDADAATVTGPSSSPRVAVSAANRCTEPITIDFRNLTAVLQEKDWRGRVKSEHTIIKVSREHAARGTCRVSGALRGATDTCAVSVLCRTSLRASSLAS